jgi:predicted GIY-YIG superfamily endonuclease
MFYVYILRSVDRPDEIYIGATSDLRGRLADHNAGKSSHTAKASAVGVGVLLRLPFEENGL